MRCSLIMPTHNRSGVLRDTIERIGSLCVGTQQDDLEIVVMDNASSEPVALPRVLDNGIRVQLIRLEENLNTAARNIAAAHAQGRWLFMLDDDSSPLDLDFVCMLDDVPAEIAAIGAEIFLPSGEHEAGGLPEVIIGCGCAIRRDMFLEVGGYDASFGYYAEEYDLCAKLIEGGRRVVHTREIRVLHRKVQAGRNFGEILFRLVRNNTWVMQRYAPAQFRQKAIDDVLDRYRLIANREGVGESYERAIRVVESTLGSQARVPLEETGWERFTGRSAVLSHLSSRLSGVSGPVQILAARQAKGREIIEQVLVDLGFEIVDEAEDATARVLGSLSPGPMLDLAQLHPDAISPWELGVGLDPAHHSR